jgi:hypothetical protein
LDSSQWETPATKHKHRRISMSRILTKATALVLNRNGQAINVRTPQEAFCMMATNGPFCGIAPVAVRRE